MKRTAALASFVALLVASTASAVTYDVKLLFDTDRKASTGCTFSTPAGTFAGAEVMVTTHVNVTGGVATTTGVIAQGCVPGTGVRTALMITASILSATIELPFRNLMVNCRTSKTKLCVHPFTFDVQLLSQYSF